MAAGIFLLCLAYVLSQFFRSFLAVLTGVLAQDLGATPDDLALASGLWFLSFSIMQIPVGSGLDKYGPRLVAAVLFLIGGAGGALVFAGANAPWHLSLAMFLIGIGCSPVLMASYYIFARSYSPNVFATLAATIVGVGTLGNLAGSVPLTILVDAIGWRPALVGLAVVTALVACGILAFVKNPPLVSGDTRGGFSDLLKIPALWLILPLILAHYAPTAGLRGLWIGPYLRDVFGASTTQVGQASMIMSVAMIIGTFAYGPMDRIFKTRKWVIICGNFAALIGLILLWAIGSQSFDLAVGLFAMIGFFGMTYPMMVAHGRSFAPPHLAGRGVTLMNLFSIGGVGVFQLITGALHTSAVGAGATGAAAYHTMLMLYLVSLGLALILYLFAQDRLD